MTEEYVPPEHTKNAFNCPNCGVYAHQRWQMTVLSSENPNGTGIDRHLSGMTASFCDRCGKFAVWDRERLFYPAMYVAPLPPADMPSEVKEDYEEARSIFSQSPRGASALLRLAIQKLVIALGESGDNLNESIGNLVKKGLPKRIQQALDIVRVIGNNAVHPGLIDIQDNPDAALKLFKLVNMIIEYMITQPGEVEALFDKLPEGAKEAVSKRDEEQTM